MTRLTLSARIIGTLLGYSPFQSSWAQFVEKVTGKSTFCMNDAMRHGNKYEDQEFVYITGKLDGIVTMADGKRIVLEVKCPYRNTLPDSNLTDFEVSKFYWAQMQIYMEILDLDEAHYVEYYRKEGRVLFRWKSVIRDKDWFKSVLDQIKRFHKEIEQYKEKGIEEHPVYKTIGNWQTATIESITLTQSQTFE
jgi:hypothetical protein